MSAKGKKNVEENTIIESNLCIILGECNKHVKTLTFRLSRFS